MNSKHLYRTAMALFLVVGVSCSEDFLDLKPIASVNSETFFTSEEDAVQAVSGAYAGVRNLVGNLIILTEVRSDNSVAHYDPGNRASGNPDREELDEFRDLSSNAAVTGFWNTSYQALYRINTVVARMDDVSMDEALKKRLTAEVKFLRAYVYFNLVQLYGDVPLVLEPITDVATAYAVGRTSLEQVYTQVVADAQEASEALPASYDNTKNNEIGRATRGAALTLLGKVYLTRKQYDAAQTALETVTTLGYALEPDFVDIFANKNSGEAIFEFQYATDVGQGFVAINNWVPRGSGAGSPWDKITQGIPGGVGVAWNIPTKSFMTIYEPDDERKDVTFQVADDAIVGAVPDPQDIQYVNKWIGYLGDSNFQVYRYADVLLMLAEIYNEKNQIGQAQNYLNQVRNRAGLENTPADNQASLRVAIELERRRELAFEGHRWFDLLRTDRAIEVMTQHGQEERANPSVYRDVPYSASSYNVQPYRLLYPIPLSEVQKNSAVLTQNPGY